MDATSDVKLANYMQIKRHKAQNAETTGRLPVIMKRFSRSVFRVRTPYQNLFY